MIIVSVAYYVCLYLYVQGGPKNRTTLYACIDACMYVDEPYVIIR